MNFRNFIVFGLLIAVLWTSRSEESPDLVVIFSRHGVRAPKDSKYDSSWGDQYGQLLPSGIRQHYLLGATWAAKYAGKALKNYSKSSVYLRAHAQNLTVRSLSAQMVGLFPPGTGPVLTNGTPALNNLIQPVPIHTMDYKTDYLLYSFSEKVCPIQPLIQRNLTEDPPKEVMKLIQPTVDKLTQIYGKNFSLAEVGAIYDVLSANYYENRPFPSKLSFVQYNDQYWKNTSFAYNWLFFYKDLATKRQRELYASLPLQEFKTKINNYLTEKVPGINPTFLSYVGHYSTLAAVLSLLNVTTYECLKTVFLGGQSLNPTCYPPGLAASLRFELYKKTNASDSYVRVFYNDDQIYLCANKTAPCTAEVFTQIIEDITGDMDVETYFSICYMTQVLNDGKGLTILFWIIVGLNILLVIVLFIILRWQRLSKAKNDRSLVRNSDLKDANTNLL